MRSRQLYDMYAGVFALKLKIQIMNLTVLHQMNGIVFQRDMLAQRLRYWVHVLSISQFRLSVNFPPALQDMIGIFFYQNSSGENLCRFHTHTPG